jgi:3-oxoacyl-[acyl-carrier-protein] synthase-3
MSSYFFEDAIADNFEALGWPLPRDKWFTNLSTKGNVGAGSIYLMLEELLNNGQLKKGEQLLLLIPESARFSYMTAWLTVC